MAIFTGIRLFLPQAVAILLLILSSVPIDVAGASAFFPAVDIMVIYYWSSYRPSALPAWFVFILGIFRDSIEGLTLGVSSCVYLLIKFIVVSSRGLYRKENFLIIWQGFAVTALLQNYLFNPLSPVISRVQLIRARATTCRCTCCGDRHGIKFRF